MTEVGKVWAGIMAGVITFCAISAAWVLLFPHGIGGAIAFSIVTGGLLGFGAGCGVWALCGLLEEAEAMDAINRDKKLARVKAEYEQMMREEERKARD